MNCEKSSRKSKTKSRRCSCSMPRHHSSERRHKRDNYREDSSTSSSSESDSDSDSGESSDSGSSSTDRRRRSSRAKYTKKDIKTLLSLMQEQHAKGLKDLRRSSGAKAKRAMTTRGPSKLKSVARHPLLLLARHRRQKRRPSPKNLKQFQKESTACLTIRISLFSRPKRRKETWTLSWQKNAILFN